MKPIYDTLLPAAGRRYPRFILPLLVALLPAGLAGADTIILKSGKAMLQVEGTIQSFDASEMVYVSASSDRQAHKSADSVLQIKSAGEPALTAAEQAYADGKWADAVSKYQAAMNSSTSDWAKYRAIVRLIDAAGMDKQFAPQVAGFVELAKRDPANAPAHRPAIAGVKAEQINAVLPDVVRATNSSVLKKESADLLKEFLADLYVAKAGGSVATKAPGGAPAQAASPASAVEAKPSTAPEGGAIGPHGPDFGQHIARKVVFVCDASGPMLNSMTTLKVELEKAVGGLKPIQSFNIIFFQDGQSVALDKAELVVATPDGKRKAYAFLDTAKAKGTSDPIPALTSAFQQRPDLIYLLSAGFPDNKVVHDKLAELNRDRKVKINTIAFVNEKEGDTALFELLRQIAVDNGGTFSKVTESELNK